MSRLGLLIVAVGLAILFCPAETSAQVKSCSELAKFSSLGTVIQSAEFIPAKSAVADFTRSGLSLPANERFPDHCKVRGSIHSRVGADKATYAIRFELRLPKNWNGKLLFQGGSGTDGVVQPAIGAAGLGAPWALARGYAVVATDSGHQGAENTSFGHEQQARLDYAYNAIGEVTRVAKAILSLYYGKTADHSYFVGCSNGGRQAMMVTQRYPLEFDGAIASDPAFDIAHMAIAEAWDTETFNAIAPRGKDGHPILSEAFTQSDLQLVSKAVLAQCDGLDGIKDGEINDFGACKFNPEVLLCSGTKTSNCLSKGQVAALKRSFNGPRDSRGRQLYASFPYDAGIGAFGWRFWKLGTSRTSTPNAMNTRLGAHALKDLVVHPYLPDLDPDHIDFDKITAEVEATHVIMDPVSTDLGTFAARGGRLIIFQGSSDPVASANDIIEYYKRFARDNGGLTNASSIARLFLIPGMTHCGGGPATDHFDALGVLEQWVEEGQAPQRIIATGHTFPHRTRPLCPYPHYAVYKGSGNPEDAANFVCK